MASPTSSDSSIDAWPSIPGCDTIIDLAYVFIARNAISKFYILTVHHSVLKGQELETKVLKLVQVLFPEWAQGVKNIQLDRISGALTK